MRVFGAALAIGLVLSFACFQLSPQIVTAYCDPGRAHGTRFDPPYPNAQVGGIAAPRTGIPTTMSADIAWYSTGPPYVDYTNGNSLGASWVWTMLFNTNCATGGFSQVGEGKWGWAPNTLVVTYFYEVEQCNGSLQGVKALSTASSASHNFKVNMNTSAPYVTALYIDNVVQAGGNISVNWGANEFAAGGETVDYDDQGFGAVQNKVAFSNFAQCEDAKTCYSNGTWCLTAGNLSNPCTHNQYAWMDLTITGSPSWKMYDSGCTGS